MSASLTVETAQYQFLKSQINQIVGRQSCLDKVSFILNNARKPGPLGPDEARLIFKLCF